MLWRPTAVLVYNTEQEADPPVPESVQVVEPKAPDPEAVKETDPEGVGEPVESVTVAVQVLAPFKMGSLGLQETEVRVGRVKLARSLTAETARPLLNSMPPTA